MIRRFPLLAVFCCAAAALCGTLDSPSARAATNIGNNFQTITLTDVSGLSLLVTPPDTQGAVGPNHFLSFTNGAYRVYTKDGTPVAAIARDTTFWNNALSNNAQPTLGGAGVTDPRIKFDPVSGRWFAAMIATSPATANDILVARSNTTDPNGAWKAVRFTNLNTSGGALFADFPTLGIDANGLYIGTNNFTAADVFANTAIYSIPKADLLAASPTAANLTRFENLSSGTRGFTPHPSDNFSLTAGSELVLSTLTNSSFGVTPITASSGPGAVLGATASVTTLTGTSPADAVQPNATNTAASATLVQDNDNRLSASVARVGNLVYTVRNVNVGGGVSGVRFTVLNATTNAVVQDSTITDTGFYDYFPAVAANESGDVLVSFSRSGFVASGDPNNRYPSSYAVVGSTSAGVVSFGPLMQLRLGTTEYLGAGGFDPAPPRWGDYSQATVDPTDPGIFWAAEEFALTSNRWGTQATELIPTKTGEIRWSASGLGSFGALANWYNSVLPGATDHAILSRPGAAYTVNVTSNAANDRLSVRQGSPTLLIQPGVTYTLTNPSAATPSLTVAEYLGTPVLTVQGGGTLQTVHTSVAAGVNGSPSSNVSQGSIVISGAGTVWNNSGDVYLGGSSTAAGGTGSLTVQSNAQTNIGGTLKLWQNSASVVVNGASLTVGGLNNPVGTTPSIALTNPGAGTALTVNGAFSSAFSGVISGPGSLLKTGAGTLTLNGNNSYGGGTTINGGVLSAGSNNALGAGSVSINAGGTLFVQPGVTVGNAISINGGTLAGKGTVTANVTIDSGDRLSPGASPGTIFGVNQTWGPAGIYVFEVNNFSGTAGSDPGWDLLDLSGTLSVTATSGNPFIIQLNSLTPGNTPGLAANFNPATSYDLYLALTSTGVTGFNASNFTVDASAFANATAGGTFSVIQGTSGGRQGIALHFAPAGAAVVPEPASPIAWLIAILAALLLQPCARRALRPLPRLN